MGTPRKWLVIAGIVAAVAVAFAVGVSVSTLLLLGAALLCVPRRHAFRLGLNKKGSRMHSFGKSQAFKVGPQH